MTGVPFFNMKDKTQTRLVITLGVMLLAALKLTGILNISWWTVTAPVWIPFGLVLVLCMVIFAFGLTVVGLAYMTLFFTKVNPSKTTITEEEFKQLIKAKYDKENERSTEDGQPDSTGDKPTYR